MSTAHRGTALLLMDLQVTNVARVTDPDYLPRAARALAAARGAGVPVLHVAVGFRPGHPEVHPRNRVFGRLPGDALIPGDPNGAIHPDVAPREGEPVVIKNRVSAFAGNDLHQLLAAGGIEHLVLAGIATGGVVLATAAQAFDLDYRLTVLGDACFDRDPAFHDALVEKYFAKRGDVLTVSEWEKALSGA